MTLLEEMAAGQLSTEIVVTSHYTVSGFPAPCTPDNERCAGSGEFLDYARPASPRREPVDLGELARRAVRSQEAAGQPIRAQITSAPGTPRALADPDQLQRAFANLVTNAGQAAGADGSLKIDVAPTDDGFVRIDFQDDGPGVPPEEVPRLFQPFHTTRAGGTGLGLALVHRVVEAHAGEIRFHPSALGGAGFAIRLPAARKDPGGS